MRIEGMKMKKAVFAWAGALLLLMSTAAPANAYSASQVMRFCGASQVEEFFCLGYVFGVVQQADVTNRNVSGPQVFCLPQQYAPEQLQAVFEKFYREHPEQWTLPATYVVVNAMVEAFPCS